MKNLSTLFGFLFTLLLVMSSCQKENLTEELSIADQPQTTVTKVIPPLKNPTTSPILLSPNDPNKATSRSEFIYQTSYSLEEGDWQVLNLPREHMPDSCQFRAAITPISGDPDLKIYAYDGTDYRLISSSLGAGLAKEEASGSLADLRDDETHLIFAIHGYEATTYHIEISKDCDSSNENTSPAPYSLENITFSELELWEGMHLTYDWTYQNIKNDEADPRRSGTITITLTEKLHHIREADFFKVDIAYTGSAWPYTQKLVWDVIGIHNGQILVGYLDEANDVIAKPILPGNFIFDGAKEDNWQVNGEGYIQNAFNSNYSADGVSIRRLTSDGGCEVIGNQTFCEDTYHSREVKEYYLKGTEHYSKGVLLNGLSRTDSHVWSGVYPTVIEKKFNLWLVDTNLLE